MKENSEAVRLPLHRLCSAGRIMGWGLIALSVVSLGGYVWARTHGIGAVGAWQTVRDVIAEPGDYLLTGLLVLGVVQFIRYLTDDEFQLGWILRKAHLILYLYALCVVVRHTMWGYSQTSFMCDSVDQGLARELLVLSLGSVITLLPGATKMLILLGMGLGLRPLLAVVAESKTLV